MGHVSRPLFCVACFETGCLCASQIGLGHAGILLLWSGRLWNKDRNCIPLLFTASALFCTFWSILGTGLSLSQNVLVLQIPVWRAEIQILGSEVRGWHELSHQFPCGPVCLGALLPNDSHIQSPEEHVGAELRGRAHSIPAANHLPLQGILPPCPLQ